MQLCYCGYNSTTVLESLQILTSSDWSFGEFIFCLKILRSWYFTFSFSSVFHLTIPFGDNVLEMVSGWLPAKHLFSLANFNSPFLECRAKPLVLLNQTALGIHFFRILLKHKSHGSEVNRQYKCSHMQGLSMLDHFNFKMLLNW